MVIGAVSAVSSRYESSQTDKKELSDEEHIEVTKLKKRDREVKAHEAAHMAAGGSCVRGGATYSYQSGPDGRRYAVGGEVSIDTSGVPGDPKATIQKMRIVRNAALAPANPSGQDRSVASAASAAQSKAQQELAKQRKDESTEKASEEKAEKSNNAVSPDKVNEANKSCCYASTGEKNPDIVQKKQINLYI